MPDAGCRAPRTVRNPKTGKCVAPGSKALLFSGYYNGGVPLHTVLKDRCPAGSMLNPTGTGRCINIGGITYLKLGLGSDATARAAEARAEARAAAQLEEQEVFLKQTTNALAQAQEAKRLVADELARTARQLRNAQARLNLHGADATSKNQRSQELEGMITSLKTQGSTKNQRIQELEGVITSLKTQGSTKNQRSQELESIVNGLKTSKNQRAQELEGMVTSLKTQESTKNQRAQELEGMVTSLKTQESAKNQRVRNLEKTLAAAQETLGAQKSTLRKQRAELTDAGALQVRMAVAKAKGSAVPWYHVLGYNKTVHEHTPVTPESIQTLKNHAKKQFIAYWTAYYARNAGRESPDFTQREVYAAIDDAGREALAPGALPDGWNKRYGNREAAALKTNYQRQYAELETKLRGNYQQRDAALQAELERRLREELERMTSNRAAQRHEVTKLTLERDALLQRVHAEPSAAQKTKPLLEKIHRYEQNKAVAAQAMNAQMRKSQEEVQRLTTRLREVAAQYDALQRASAKTTRPPPPAPAPMNDTPAPMDINLKSKKRKLESANPERRSQRARRMPNRYVP